MTTTTSNVFLAGPLTTMFTPPSPCGPVPNDFGRLSSSYSCLPPNYLQHYAVGADGWLGWYSPGICPKGYTPACSPSTFPRQGLDVGATETARLCAYR